MRQSFAPDALFDTRREIICPFPLDEREVLLAVLVPTPTGWQRIDSSAIDEFWRGCRVEDIVRPLSGLSQLSNADINRRRAVYFVVVKLHEMGLLNSANEPTASALSQTALACKAVEMPKRTINPNASFPAHAPVFDLDVCDKFMNVSYSVCGFQLNNIRCNCSSSHSILFSIFLFGTLNQMTVDGSALKHAVGTSHSSTASASSLSFLSSNVSLWQHLSEFAPAPQVRLGFSSVLQVFHQCFCQFEVFSISLLWVL